MVRYLALLIVCVIAVLAQVGPSMAHVGEPRQSSSEQSLADAVLTTSPTLGDDCDGAASCCAAMCVPCYMPLPAQQIGFAIGPSPSRPMALRRDCMRSIILGRDPPIPRNPLL